MIIEKKILFLSANDFKAKSIQVLRKTPEAFVDRGWNVKYIVARDFSKKGNYFYEDIIDIQGVDVERFSYPFTKLRNVIGNSILQTIITQIAGYLVVLFLAFKAYKSLRKSKFDVIYGYEVHGVCAVKLLRFFGLLNGIKIVSRFQGTWVNLYLENRNYFKLLFNWDDLLALKSYADFCIMTNDGTQGDQALRTLNSKALFNMKFWVNGVDNQLLSSNEFADLNLKYKVYENRLKIISVSRLEEWKRIDRILMTISYLVNVLGFKDIVYFMVGDGRLKADYERFIQKEGLQDFVVLVGGLPNFEVKKYLNFADIFISTYDLSNVGNPLLEAISAHKIIFTLNNGDTSSWIQHKINGFIYNIDENLYKNMANDMVEIVNNPDFRLRLKQEVIKTEQEKLWNWNQRLNAEVDEVEKLLK